MRLSRVAARRAPCARRPFGFRPGFDPRHRPVRRGGLGRPAPRPLQRGRVRGACAWSPPTSITGCGPTRPTMPPFCRTLCASLDVPLRVGRRTSRAGARRDGDGRRAGRAARAPRVPAARRQGRGGGRGRARPHARRPGGDGPAAAAARVRDAAGSAPCARGRAACCGPCWPCRGATCSPTSAAAGLAWREDPSNRDLRFARNRVRHELLPYLESHFNPHVRETLARSAEVLADEADVLAGAAARLLRRARADDAGGPALSRSVLRAAAPAVAALAIRRLLDEAGGLRDVGASQVDVVCSAS